MAAGAFTVTKLYVPPSTVGIAVINLAHADDYATGGIVCDLSQLRVGRHEDLVGVIGQLYSSVPAAYTVRLVKGANWAADKIQLFAGSSEVANATTLAASGKILVVFGQRRVA